MRRKLQSPRLPAKFGAWVAVGIAVASCFFVVWASAAGSMDYLRYYTDHQCGTGRMGALGMVTLTPLLASLPFGAWCVCRDARTGIAVARCATFASLAASLFASTFVCVIEQIR